MFLRFSKGAHTTDKEFIQTLRKCVFLGDNLVMEYGDKIVGVAKLHAETQTALDYDVIVADHCPLGGDTIARYIKNMIGKSNKFSATPTAKRRKYYVEKINSDTLPIKAELKLTRI